jgi:hypothetical protein
MNSAEEKWLQEHTRRCPIGRITKGQCERLRARPTIKDASAQDKLIRPQVCMGCQWWLYFPGEKARQVA